ncbi:MAG TPA: cell division protein [Lachnospiraceae bacterium]|nr:putative peptidoglycan glycosyltransferase FtsW [Lachnospiraceae bacterium]MDY4164397.1 putative peptidoglycan glycosyltransferase FtsW [Lachnospiraceae bacterium]HAP02585.1 cell division protein [Lachnospiraceae bacterium]
MRDRTRAKTVKFKNYTRQRYFDYILLGVVALLILFGLVMLYSSSAYTASVKLSDPTYYLKRQAVFVIIGAVLAMIVTFIPNWLMKRFAGAFFAFMFLLNVAVIFVGKSSNGSTRWISIAGFRFQPSEFLKIAIIVAMATFISKHTRQFGEAIFDVVGIVIIAFAIAPVIGSNLSTALIIAGIGYVMLFIASRRKKNLFLVALFGILGAVIATFAKDYRQDRIQYWLHPEKATSGEGFQVLQGLYAIGSGGFFGKGLGASDTKLGNLPESQNDMIFAVIVEELGAFGAVCLILMYVVLLWRLYLIAVNARDMFGSYIVIGVFSHLSLQMILNMLVVTNIIPNTGVTLPFVSYGGSSIICTLIEMGLVFSVARQIPMEHISLGEEV